MIKIWNFLDEISYSVISTLISAVGKNYSKSNHRMFMQFVKFCLVGLFNTIVYYLIYSISLFIFKKYGVYENFDYQIAQVLGFIFSVFGTFNINRKYVFKTDKESYILALGKFYLTYSFTGLIINSVLLYCWKSIGISEFVAPFINIFFTTPLNFLLSKLWAFKEHNFRK